MTVSDEEMNRRWAAVNEIDQLILDLRAAGGRIAAVGVRVEEVANAAIPLGGGDVAANLAALGERIVAEMPAAIEAYVQRLHTHALLVLSGEVLN